MPEMIPCKPDRAKRDQYCRNLMDAYLAVTEDQHARGMAWYPNAHAFAVMLADGGDPRMVAGAIAALSAQKSWELNMRLAQDAANGRIHGHTRDVLDKVGRIMSGTDPAMVLPMDKKTGHFYRCIADPTDADAVVIDRHAHDIAVGEIYGDADRGLDSKSRYAMLALCYREVAAELGILPMQLQAILWVAHTERKNH